VLLSPTVRVPTQPISPGAELPLSGATAPLAQVTVSLRPEGVKSPTRNRTATTTANGSGVYQLTLPTSGLNTGVYEIVSSAQLPVLGLESDEGITKYGLGVSTPAAGTCSNPSDLNCDGKVNLIDFSILLFNWNTSNATADINKDSIVNLTDFSIMIFNWTG
jgi:Dockerin type I domain